MNSGNGLRRRKGGGAAVAEPARPVAMADDRSYDDDSSTDSGGEEGADHGNIDDEYGLDGPPLVPSEILDQSFRHAIGGAASVWALLWISAAVFTPRAALAPQETGGASLALGAASLVMGVSFVTRGLALLFREPVPGAHGPDGTQPSVVGSRISGAALLGFFVQACSAVNNGTMAFCATPLFIDPITGMDVYILRWCEWAPLAFLMAYLTASMDAEERNGGGLRAALMFGLYQGISTLCGLLFPFVGKYPVVWWTLMVFSCALHVTLYPLLVSKTKKLWALPTEPAHSAAEMERRDRIRVAAQLIQLVTVAWTTLVSFYFIAWALQVSPTTHALMECSVEVLSKHLYLNFLLDAHHRIFDPSKKAERGLAEIGYLMNQVSDRRSSYSLDSDDDLDLDEDDSLSDDDTSTAADDDASSPSARGAAAPAVARSAPTTLSPVREPLKDESGPRGAQRRGSRSRHRRVSGVVLDDVDIPEQQGQAQRRGSREDPSLNSSSGKPRASRSDSFSSFNMAVDSGSNVADEVVGGIRQLIAATWDDANCVPGVVEMPLHREAKAAIQSHPTHRLPPKTLDDVTIVFSDVVGFTSICSKLDVEEVGELITRLFSEFDDICEVYDVKKIDIIGDAFFGLCGKDDHHDDSDESDGEDHDQHAAKAALFALDAVSAANEIMVCPTKPDLGKISIRFGVASGSVVSTVMGSGNHLKRTLFGDVVNTASRMESTSTPNRVQCTKETAELLRKQCPQLELESRGVIDVKGKGELETYFVNQPKDVQELCTLIW